MRGKLDDCLRALDLMDRSALPIVFANIRMAALFCDCDISAIVVNIFVLSATTNWPNFFCTRDLSLPVKPAIALRVTVSKAGMP
jgi:hypothetical protein